MKTFTLKQFICAIFFSTKSGSGLAKKFVALFFYALQLIVFQQQHKAAVIHR
jgi:hypothetical protein